MTVVDGNMFLEVHNNNKYVGGGGLFSARVIRALRSFDA